MRGRGKPQRGDQVRLGITPAYAGKRQYLPHELVGQ